MRRASAMTERGALVLVTTSFPIVGDGSEAAGSFVSDLAETIAEHSPVRVVAPGHARGIESWARNIEVFRYAAPEQPLSTLKPWLPAQAAQIGRVLRAGATATREAVSAGPAAHILALWAFPSGHWARRAARQSGVSYSTWTLGSDIWTLGRVPLLRTYLRKILRESHTVYSDGLELADDTRRLAGRDVEFLPSTRRILRHRVQPLRSSAPYRLLFLGRWHANKGVDLLLDALMKLDVDDWRRIESVEIAGGGPLEPLVKAGVQQLLDNGRPVALRGYLDKTAAEEAILQADYLLIPSRIESIPVVFSDAMKLGCPVVCMPVGDLPRLVEQQPHCGVVADAVSADGFAQALARVLAMPAASFAAGTSVRAQQFDLDGAARRIVADWEIDRHA